MLGSTALLAASLAIAAPKIPDDVLRCIRAQKMWVAAPDFFEKLTIDGQPAYQILDHHQGRDGYLLVLPTSCWIAVLIKHPNGRMELTYPPGKSPTVKQLEILFRWAGVEGRAENGTFFFLHDGVLDAIDLASGERRAMELKASPSCSGRLSKDGLELPCDATRKLIRWPSLRAWMRWESAPNQTTHFEPEDTN